MDTQHTALLVRGGGQDSLIYGYSPIYILHMIGRKRMRELKWEASGSEMCDCHCALPLLMLLLLLLLLLFPFHN